MTLRDELADLLIRLESLLVDLDRLDMPIIAAHVDLAARRLESIIDEPSKTLLESDLN